MVPSTPASATTPSPPEVPPRSGIPSNRWRACPHSRPARTPNPGNLTPQGLSRVTKSCAHRSAWVEPSGDDGAGTTAEAALKPRCTASSSSGSACPRETSTVRLQRSRSVSPSSTGSPPSAHPLQRSRDRSVRGKGTSDRHQICATEPIYMANDEVRNQLSPLIQHTVQKYPWGSGGQTAPGAVGHGRASRQPALDQPRHPRHRRVIKQSRREIAPCGPFRYFTQRRVGRDHAGNRADLQPG